MYGALLPCRRCSAFSIQINPPHHLTPLPPHTVTINHSHYRKNCNRSPLLSLSHPLSPSLSLLHNLGISLHNSPEAVLTCFSFHPFITKSLLILNQIIQHIIVTSHSPLASKLFVQTVAGVSHSSADDSSINYPPLTLKGQELKLWTS